ncbi:uncharacterized protein LOC128725025 [Anopheles nili]|uniref:uncharacterized protein LOC128725025 n=1 Tax=Anopheles nili TaxID=185578 RepID=UPI00237AE77D|nr:uncharacterized protein LOC128725025 [Anopheles nili]
MHLYPSTIRVITLITLTSPLIHSGATQVLECVREVLEYNPGQWDQFCVFRSISPSLQELNFFPNNADNVAFINSTIPSLPENFYIQFTNLKVLLVQNIGLITLTITDSMQIVYAQHNLIHTLIINGGKKMTMLYLQNNPITTMQNITHNLTGLQILDVSHTSITSETDNTIDFVMFATMPNLTELNLAHVDANYVENEAQLTLPNLKILNLSGNIITASNFDLSVFRSLPSLEELYLSDTALPHLSISNMRDDFPALQRIHLEGNDFKCDFLQSLLVHLKEQQVEVLATSRKCYLGYEKIEGMCCKRDITNIGNTLPTITDNINPTVPSVPKDSPSLPKEGLPPPSDYTFYIILGAIVMAVLFLSVACYWLLKYIIMKYKGRISVPDRDGLDDL